MAVVQISKIQVRRGQKRNGVGIPQLSSGELAWAVDTQEVFIGNGSIAEGAPYVGNTKVLTEHDNILELAASYTFAGSDPSITASRPRSLQSKLDEYVSVIDFGAIGDGSTDCTLAFQNALTQLFRNADSKFKKILYVPNGTYLFQSSLRIPSTVIIRGENQLETILNIGISNIVLVSENGTELGSPFTGTDRPHDISISNLTIQHTSGQLSLSGLLDGLIEDVKFVSTYVLGSGIGEPSVSWENTTAGTAVTNVRFTRCLFDSTPIGIECLQTDILPDNVFETSIIFDNCYFYNCEIGIHIDSVDNMRNNWQINDCSFVLIAAQAIISTSGYGTLVQRSKFINCGNGSSSSSYPVSPIISFGALPLVVVNHTGNVVTECSFDRHRDAGFDNVGDKIGVPEVLNAARVGIVDQYTTVIRKENSFFPLSVFSALSKEITLDYTLRLGNHTRRGQLMLTVNNDLSWVSISDNYQYSAPYFDDRPITIFDTELGNDITTTIPGGVLMLGFEFDATLVDRDSDSGIETVLLSYRNPINTGSTGTITYSIGYGV